MEDGVTPATIERDINGGWSDPCHKRKGPKEVREATTTNERASPVQWTEAPCSQTKGLMENRANALPQAKRP